MDVTKKIRAENVRYLINEKCAGNKSDFARRIDSSVQHVSKILRALDPDADQLKDTAKKYVGDDIAARIEKAFDLPKGQLSTGNLETLKHGSVNQPKTTAVPLINWEDINSFIDNKKIPMELINVPDVLSENSFVTRLSDDIGSAIKGLALPGDIIGIDLNIRQEDIVNNNYVLAKISGSKSITCWKVKKIGLEILLQNEEFPDRMHEGDWKLVGLIKFSIKGI